MDINANTNALTNPHIKNGTVSNVKYCQLSTNEIVLAPNMIGTAMMKVKSAAAR